MTVDFEFKRTPSYRIASIRWKGTWSDAKIHAQFGRIQKWARAKGVRTGKWIFMEPGEKEWEVALELKAKAAGDGEIRVRTLPACRVASVEFDPEVVSPAVVYHGVTDWLRWRRKDGKVRSVGAYREVYDGDPWTDKKAAAHVNVQVVVRP